MSASDNHAADWVQANLNGWARQKGEAARVLSPFQREAMRVLERGFKTGIYNLSVRWDRVDWRFGPGVALVVYVGRGLATYDFDHLTRLVFAAHDACIRLEIEPRAKGYARIILSPRQREAETFMDGHPTVETALARWRATYPAEPGSDGEGAA